MPRRRLLHSVLLLFQFSLAPFSFAGVNRWTSGGPEGGTILDFAFHPASPSTLYIGSHAGLFRSTDSGVTWGQTGFLLPSVSSVVFDPTTPSTLYLAYSGFSSAVYKSEDGGLRWARASQGLPSAFFLDLAIDPANTATLYVGHSRGISKSTDRAANWLASDSGLPINARVSAVAIDPLSSSTLYAVANFGVFKSTNAGASWTPAETGLATPVFAIEVDPSTPSVLYAGTQAGVYKTLDAGGSWSPAGMGIPSVSVTALAIDPSSPEKIYAGTFGGEVFRSADGGASWSAVTNGLPVSSGITNGILVLAVDPGASATLYAAPLSRGVLKSNDRGDSWKASNTGLRSVWVNSLVVDPAEPAIVYAASRTFGGVFKSADGGRSWSNLQLLTGAEYCLALAAAATAPTTLYAATDRKVLKSTDGGAGWTPTHAGNLVVGFTSLSVDPSNALKLYGWNSSDIYRSSDGGQTWGRLIVGNAFAFVPSNPSILYAAWGGRMLRSRDDGLTWVFLSLQLSEYDEFTTLALDPIIPTTLYAGTAASGIFKSVDGGDSWHPANVGLDSRHIRALIPDSWGRSIYAGTSGPTFFDPGGNGGSVFRSTNGGASWSALTGGLPNRHVGALAIDPSGTRLHAAIGDGESQLGVFDYEIAGMSFHTVPPCRAVDTRAGGTEFLEYPIAAGSVRDFTIAGRCGIPVGARVVAANVTVVAPTAAGHLSLFPQVSSFGNPPPPSLVFSQTSNVNFRAGQTRASNALLEMARDWSFFDRDGGISVYSAQVSGSAHLLIDVSGYFE